MPDPKIISPEAIAALRDLNPGDNDVFLKEIIGIYVEDTPVRINELKKSLAAGDGNLFTRAAHTIKGSSANLGAIGVAGAAEALENKSRTGGLAGVAGLASLVEQCESEFARAAAELRRLAP
jgi:HPt (histidine-containing phosphotransfer) domain-containing protein